MEEDIIAPAPLSFCKKECNNIVLQPVNKGSFFSINIICLKVLTENNRVLQAIYWLHTHIVVTMLLSYLRFARALHKTLSVNCMYCAMRIEFDHVIKN